MLIKLIRDKQPYDVIEQMRNIKPETIKQISKTELLTVFTRDALKALPIIESTLMNIDTAKKDDLRLFITTVHAMKSALGNISEREAAELAEALEKAGKDGDKAIIKAETQNFIDLLTAIVSKNSAVAESVEVETDESVDYLQEQVQIIKSACAEYDDMTAKAVLVNLRKMPWKKDIKDVLDKIDEHLLHSDFEKAEEEIVNYLLK